MSTPLTRPEAVRSISIPPVASPTTSPVKRDIRTLTAFAGASVLFFISSTLSENRVQSASTVPLSTTPYSSKAFTRLDPTSPLSLKVQTVSKAANASGSSFDRIIRPTNADVVDSTDSSNVIS